MNTNVEMQTSSPTLPPRARDEAGRVNKRVRQVVCLGIVANLAIFGVYILIWYLDMYPSPVCGIDVLVQGYTTRNIDCKGESSGPCLDGGLLGLWNASSSLAPTPMSTTIWVDTKRNTDSEAEYLVQLQSRWPLQTLVRACIWPDKHTGTLDWQWYPLFDTGYDPTVIVAVLLGFVNLVFVCALVSLRFRGHV